MQYKTLHLTVDDKKVSWVFEDRKSGADNPDRELKGDMSLKLDGQLKETIDLLVKLQRWLGDAIAEKSLAPGKLTTLNERLNDLTRVVGQSLYAVLFSGQPQPGDKQLSTVLLDELNALGADDLLRIRLEFGGSEQEREELSGWPWEYMYIPREGKRKGTGTFLAPHAQLVLTRRVYLTDQPLPLVTPQPVCVLLVCAAPEHLGPIHYEKVLEKIEELEKTGAFKLEKLIEPPIKDAQFEQGNDWHPTVSFQEFEKKVDSVQPHVIHFIGHGQLREGRGELAFVDADGKPDWQAGFAKIAAHSKQLKLVFLQACESALLDPHTPISSVARQCAQENVPAIIAMQAKIENEAASIFACRFYTELAKHQTVDCAVLEARKAMGGKTTAFGVPVLYLRNYEKLIEAEKTRPVGGGQQYICDRCKEGIKAASPKFCTRCQLRFYCPECDPPHKLANPWGDTPPDDGCVYCDECGHKVRQELWPKPALPSNVVQMDTIIPAVRSGGESDTSASLPPPPEAMDIGKRVIDIKAESGN